LRTEWGQRAKHDQALEIKNTEIVKELALPPVKIHCSVLAKTPIRAAIGELEEETGNANPRKCGQRT